MANSKGIGSVQIITQSEEGYDEKTLTALKVDLSRSWTIDNPKIVATARGRGVKKNEVSIILKGDILDQLILQHYEDCPHAAIWDELSSAKRSRSARIARNRKSK